MPSLSSGSGREYGGPDAVVTAGSRLLSNHPRKQRRAWNVGFTCVASHVFQCFSGNI